MGIIAAFSDFSTKFLSFDFFSRFPQLIIIKSSILLLITSKTISEIFSVHLSIRYILFSSNKDLFLISLKKNNLFAKICVSSYLISLPLSLDLMVSIISFLRPWFSP